MTPTLGDVPAETHTNQGPLDRNGVFELIRDQLADILETDPSSITEGASFTEDLDAELAGFLDALCAADMPTPLAIRETIRQVR